MKKSQIAFLVLVFVTLIALLSLALVSGIGFGLDQIRQLFAALEPQTGIILGVTSLSVLMGAGFIASAIRTASRRRIDNRERADRARIYEGVVDALSGIGRNAEHDLELSRSDSALLLRGSGVVLKEYRALRDLAAIDVTGPDKVRTQFNRLLLAMRRDIGAETYGMGDGDWLNPTRSTGQEPTLQPNEPNFVLQPRPRAA